MGELPFHLQLYVINLRCNAMEKATNKGKLLAEFFKCLLSHAYTPAVLQPWTETAPDNTNPREVI